MLLAVSLALLAAACGGQVETTRTGPEPTAPDVPSASVSPGASDQEPVGAGDATGGKSAPTAPDPAATTPPLATPGTPAPTEEPSAGPSASPEVDPGPGLYQVGPPPQISSSSGEVSVAATAPTDGASIPVLIHNGLDVPISDVEIVGTILDGAGRISTPGRSRLIHPNLIPPGGVAVGVVHAGPERLLDDAVLRDRTLDYTEGEREVEPVLGLEVTTLEVDSESVTGTVRNPHDDPVMPPLSVVLACLDSQGRLGTVHSGYLDVDQLAPGATAAFELERSGGGACAGRLGAASGYAEDLLSLGAPASGAGGPAGGSSGTMG